MSVPAGSVRGAWLDPGARASARARLATAVGDLVRARRRQIRSRLGWAGIVCGLLLSTAAVLAIRLDLVAGSAWHAVAAITAACWGLSMLLAWHRRPDDLDVAIRADVRLNMKQRMSTAWELMRDGGNEALAECLAAQAVRARLPSRSASVFPSEVGLAMKLAPLAALLLVMAATVDLGWLSAPAGPPVDESVVREGVRLRGYGQRMEARARGEDLPRAREQAGRVQRLGARMESGALTRAQALSRLRALGEGLEQQRREALAEGPQTQVGPLRTQPLAGSPLVTGGDARRMLERLQAGVLGAGEARGLLSGDSRALSRAGIAPGDLDRALQDFAAGDAGDLSRILERLSRLDRSLQEADELADAREQVNRARESLGEPLLARRAGVDRPTAGGAPAADQDDARGNGAASPFDGEDEGGSASGLGQQPGGGGTRREPEPAAAPPADGPALDAGAKPGSGAVFVSQARVLPRPSTPGVPATALDPRFVPQVEAALAREDVPARHKAFIRRYFLNLSQGVRGDAP